MGRDGRGRGENRGGDHEARGLQHGLGQGLRSGHLSGKNRAHFAKNYHHLQTDLFFYHFYFLLLCFSSTGMCPSGSL